MATDSKDKRRKAVAAPKSAPKSAKTRVATKVVITQVSETAAEVDNDTTAVSRSTRTRKRAAEFLEGDDAQKEEPAGNASAAKPEKPKKKARTSIEADTKPSKVDGHPIETAKTQPGGDMVEVEPTDVPKSITKKKGKKKLPAAKDYVAQSAGGIQKSLTDEVTTVTEGAVDTKGKGKKKLSAAKDSIAQSAGGIQKSLTDEVTDITEGAVDAKGKGKKKLSAAKDYVVQTADGAQKSLMDDVTEAAEGAVDAKKKGKKKVSAAKDYVAQTADDASKSLMDNVTDAAEGAVDAKKKGKKKISAAKDYVAQTADDAQKSLMDNVTDAAEGAVDAKKNVEEKLSAAKDYVAQSADGIQKSLTDKVSDVTEGAVDAKRKGEKKFSAAKDYVAQSADGIQKSVTDTVTDVTEGAVDAKRKGEKKLSAAKDYVAQSADGIQKSLTDKVTDVTEKTINAKNEGQKKLSATKDYVAQSAGDIQKSLTDKVTDVTEGAIDTKRKGEKKLAAVKDYVAQTAGGAQESLMDNVTEAAEGAVDAKKKVEKKLSKSVSKKGKAMKKEERIGPAEGASTTNTETPENLDTAGDSTLAGEGHEDEEVDEDDQTAALLKGFESSDEEDVSGDESSFKEGMEIPKLPNAKKLSKQLASIKDNSDSPGVVYVGRIPHGFYEHEMRAYFSQFGPVQRLRLSRNRKTGRSKHYAFIEFASAEVAKIAAETMDNYLLFNHIMKCKVIEKEQVHEDLWKGANRRFKVVPHNRLEGRHLEMGMGREKWAGRIEEERERREKKKVMVKEVMGYEYEGVELKGVEDVPVRELKRKALDMGDAGTAIEETGAGLEAGAGAEAEAEADAGAEVGGQVAEQQIIEEENTIVRDGEGTVVVSEDIKVKKTRKVAKKDKLEGEGEGVGETAKKRVKRVKK